MTTDRIATTLPQIIQAEIHAPIPHSAMLFAAGLGTRMRPLSDDRPKALVEMGGKPLIAYSLQHLERAGVKRLVVNVHAHADQMENWLAQCGSTLEILCSDERDLLRDTGGGLKKAAPLLGPDPVFTLNCDAFWQDGLVNSLAYLASRWDGDVMDALLMIVPSRFALGYEGPGDFIMDQMGRLQFREDRTISPFVFAGISILKPELAADHPGDLFSLREIWAELALKDRLYGLVHEGPWAHLGSPEALRLAERKLLD
ncbi:MULTISPECIES: nucleotidyltransferase family protein [unclassified Iodidimonas]|jgi:MurNAc alpha-1-phosphate uridylyltransferase|uniref:nucleotidyltransferase family protein n=1 Tax=unclassified Iodidimonas TaxID=2626145 RepID=UPI0024825F4D|nr:MULTISPECIES: nucleotidyltransferase family protein [unclassified Iodidimonas]